MIGNHTAHPARLSRRGRITILVVTAALLAGAGTGYGLLRAWHHDRPSSMPVTMFTYPPDAPVAKVTPGDTVTGQPVPLPGSTQQVRLPDQVKAVPVSDNAWAVVQPGQPLTDTTRQGVAAGIAQAVTTALASSDPNAAVSKALDQRSVALAEDGLTLLVTYAMPDGTTTAWTAVHAADGSSQYRSDNEKDADAARQVVQGWLKSQGVDAGKQLVVDVPEQGQ